MYVSGNEDSDGRRLYGTYFPYVPEATSVTIRHVGPTKFTDNLGNQYRGGGYTKHHNNEESFNLHGLDPNATSISFKYLLARTVYAFELRDLPLPS
jgi:hypothetical protein